MANLSTITNTQTNNIPGHEKVFSKHDVFRMLSDMESDVSSSSDLSHALLMMLESPLNTEDKDFQSALIQVANESSFTAKSVKDQYYGLLNAGGPNNE